MKPSVTRKLINESAQTITGYRGETELMSFAGLFRSVIDPFLVIATFQVLALCFDLDLDGESLILLVLLALLSRELLDGGVLFLPGEQRSFYGLLHFARQWLLFYILIGGLGWISGLGTHFHLPHILLSMLMAPLVLIAVHGGVRCFVLHRHAQQPYKRAVIAGANRPGRVLADKFRSVKLLRTEFLGFFDDRDAERSAGISEQDVLGRLDDLVAFVREHAIEHVYLSLPMHAHPRVIRLMDELADTPASVFFVPDFYVFDLIQPKIDHVAGLPVVSVCESPFVGPNKVLKRGSDLLVATFILGMIWPLMLIIALAIKLTSKGPVLFQQKRYGANGECILVYKFRSMKVMENDSVIVQASKNDARLTPIGGFLRKSSLDELPQFLNVLNGSMSIVGPRPHANAHNEQYRALIKGYMVRHKVKPGITGWAQVNGYRGETDTLDKMQKRVEFDLDYLRHWSLGLDFKIILRTVLVIFYDKNAY